MNELLSPIQSKISEPSDLEELQLLVKNSRNIRTFTPSKRGELLPAETYCNMKNFNRILYITDVSITCESSTPIQEIIAFVANRNCSLAITPNEYYSTIGELIASTAYPNILELTFINAKGELISITPASEHFRYFVASMEMLAILYSCTLGVVAVKEKVLYQNRTYTHLPLDPIGWVKGGLHRRLCYNPYTNKCLMYDHSYDNIYGEDHASRAHTWFQGKRGLKVSSTIREYIHFLIPTYIDAFFKASAGRSSGSAYQILSNQEKEISSLEDREILEILEFESAVLVNEAYAMLDTIQALIMNWKSQGYYLWLGVEMSFKPADNHPLSACYQQDVIMFKFRFNHSEEDADEFIQSLQQVMGNRFNIAEYSLLPVSSCFGWDEFNRVRVLYDLENKFSL